MALAVIASATHAELHMPDTSAYPSIVPKTSVPFDADDPLKVHPNARGEDALVTLREIRPETDAPTETLAFTAIELFAEHSAVNTPSVIPFDGTVIVPLTIFTPLSMFKVGLQARSSFVCTRVSVASPMSISLEDPYVRDPSEQLRVPIETAP